MGVTLPTVGPPSVRTSARESRALSGGRVLETEALGRGGTDTSEEVPTSADGANKRLAPHRAKNPTTTRSRRRFRGRIATRLAHLTREVRVEMWLPVMSNGDS
ncbi:hypothetical protein F0U62_30365 [Cystobacter fuscus]|uniref:hypothetical protein n=1 Tax=Cystobacter fuscus TaxID=43 RepID=UPI002B2D52EA|nr:hypothetical protein F0U62_30365 [Cystobacter fuscus]